MDMPGQSHVLKLIKRYFGVVRNNSSSYAYKGLIRIVIYKVYVITVFLTTPKYHILDRQQYTIITVRDLDSYTYIYIYLSLSLSFVLSEVSRNLTLNSILVSLILEIIAEMHFVYTYKYNIAVYDFYISCLSL